MEINIRGKGIELTEALKDYAQKKIHKVEHFFHNIQQIDIELEVDKIREQVESQVAKATVWMSGKAVHASEASSDMYAAIDLLIDKLDKQVKKFKEKIIQEKRRESAKEKHILHENLAEPERETSAGE
ncbi:MAG: ribosome-associated translation inhibitor RaiA [Candidatus Margulisiibacteriota bacterium]